MPKHTYQSPAEFLARKFNFVNFLRSLYFKINKFDDEITLDNDSRRGLVSILLAGFNPLRAMGKDLVDTFKPYKSNFYVLRDFIQPLRGIGNILRGLFNLVVSPILFLVNILRYVIAAIEVKSFNSFISNLNINFTRTLAGLLDGVNSLIRGATQVGTTPLTWLRIPIRLFITTIAGQPTVSQNIEERIEDLESLILQENKTFDDCMDINNELSDIKNKLIKSKQRGQAIGADYDVVMQSYTEGALDSAFTRMVVQTNPNHRNSNTMFITYPVASDTETNRNIALNFLSFFKSERKSVSEDSTNVSELSGSQLS